VRFQLLLENSILAAKLEMQRN